jgi:nicotinate-nucleotide adenylyltransferase
MNIALFGGSFDPFHVGHEAIVIKLLNTLPIEKLFIAPTYINPFKDSYMIEPQMRLEILRELYEKESKVQILSFEVDEKRKVPTIETIEYLTSKYQLDTIHLVIGADNFNTIFQWNRYEELKKLVVFVVITRNGYNITNKVDNYIEIKLDFDVSSTELRENLNINLIPKKIQKRIKKLWKKD